MKDALGYYEILEINSVEDIADIKSKYHKLAKYWHPDSNKDPQAMEHFQKISVAYEVLSDEEKRLKYDMLSQIYNSSNFPDMDNLSIIKSKNNEENPFVRIIMLQKVIGKIFSYSVKTDKLVCSYIQTKQEVLHYSFINWFCGWWHPKSFILNAKAIINNIKNINSNTTDNLVLWIHNAVAYHQAGQDTKAIISAQQAMQYGDLTQRKLLNDFINSLNIKLPQKNISWRSKNLIFLQLIVPFLMVLIASYPYFQSISLNKYMNKNNEITYFQKVKLNNGTEIVDDMVVSKIFSIPINVNDNTKLYHLKSSTKILYGPNDNFDVIAQGKSQQTVRITGFTADKSWYRIMLDDGSMGFIPKNSIEQGVGTPPPYGSKIIP